MKTQINNKYYVGQILYTDWGYDQTNIDFFQVVKVCDKSIRVVEVRPERTTLQSGFMCCDFTAKIPDNNELLPPVTNSIFVKDHIHGDVCRIIGESAKVNGRYWLMPYHGQKLYESWYA